VGFDVPGESRGNKPGVLAAPTRRERLSIHACDFMFLNVARVVDNPINSRRFDCVSRLEFLSDACSHGVLPRGTCHLRNGNCTTLLFSEKIQAASCIFDSKFTIRPTNPPAILLEVRLIDEIGMRW